MKQLLSLFVTVILLSTISFAQGQGQSKKKVIDSDRNYMKSYNSKKRVKTEELIVASRTKPTTTGKPSKNPAGQKVLFLDFDGHYLAGTSWNWSGNLNLAYSGMNSVEIDSTISRFRKAYAAYNVIVTTDSTVYATGDVNNRMRVILTESWEWYGQAGGVAYLNSFTWGDNTPCFVFTSLLNYNFRYVAEAAIHEAGHTLGLRHQSDCSGTVVTREYRLGPFMGVSYYETFGGRWIIGTNNLCSTQDDNNLITKSLGLK